MYDFVLIKRGQCAGRSSRQELRISDNDCVSWVFSQISMISITEKAEQSSEWKAEAESLVAHLLEEMLAVQ